MKRTLVAAFAALALAQTLPADIDSLSRLFLPGRAVLDLDGDGFPERPALTIVVPDQPTARELALAADIAARLNFESLAVEFGLVKSESEIDGAAPPRFPVLIGGGLTRVREALRARGLDLSALAPNEGRVFLDTRPGRAAVICVAGSDDALLKTGRAFFLRWPYLWEVWGRETGATYERLEEDLEAFLDAAGLGPRTTIVREAVYAFPAPAPVSDGLQALDLDEGQIAELAVEVRVASGTDLKKAEDALRLLASDRRRGSRTRVLSYPACAALSLELSHGASRAEIVLPRTGATKRLLTPGFKERPKAPAEGKVFDLLGVFSSRAAYADQDRDGVPDAIESVVVVPGERPARTVTDLASRLVLGAAGASFPLVRLDSEIEARKALTAPVLVGENTLAADLVKTGKLKSPEGGPGTGTIEVVPEAFGKSSAVVVRGADRAGLNAAVGYLSRTFPFLKEYGEGNPGLEDLAADVGKFLEGAKGGAEAFLMAAVEEAAAGLEGRALDSVAADLALPGPNAPFEKAIRDTLESAAGGAPVRVEAVSLKDGRTVFEKEKAFAWEVDEAKALLEANLRAVVDAAGKGGAVEVSIGISESPSVREKVRGEVEAFLTESGFPGAKVEVLSAYKPGFFWLVERVLPALAGKPVERLAIRCAEEPHDFTRARRAHAEPARWLQELYPVDEILSRELGLPLDRVTFELAEPGGDVYTVEAIGAKGTAVHADGFSPRTREIALSSVLPEWGTARATTGWVRIVAGGRVVCDQALETDLEKFWTFYQEDVLKAVVAHIRDKTGGQPTFSKQPYFKRLFVDLQASEPDDRIGLDEEIVSSLEAIHDEIYFDTLDLLRGITRFDPEDKDVAADTSRSSAPGNIYPSLHPSLEGAPASARVVLEDWPAPAPQVVLRWKEKGHEEVTRTFVYPSLEPKETRVSRLVFDGRAGRVADVLIETEWEKESDYLSVIDIAGAWRRLFDAGVVKDPFRFPGLDAFTLRARHQNRAKDERLAVVPAKGRGALSDRGGDRGASGPGGRAPGGVEIVTTREIISPATAGEIVGRLAALPGVRGYIGGRSYEGREVPVLELFLPFDPYVSLPRLVTVKPTLQVVARQHANEVSSTNYLLRFAELLARDPATREALKSMNFVFEPLENPDGAQLAFEMLENEPFHSLHAGRYGALGVDMGYQTGTKPLLPEAAVRTRLYERWAPDIFLNLHGYPSHEWVQPFSNYTPYLFRDYWIPRGWFAYFRSVRLPIHEDHREAGEALRKAIADELASDPVIAASNRKFYARYERWAARWAPHLNELEIEGGVNIYARRRGPTESRLTARARTTFSEQTPELMDETATGDWLDFLCAQGLAYLRAHVGYLARADYPVVRIEEEVGGRVRLTLVRKRPGEPGTREGPGP